MFNLPTASQSFEVIRQKGYLYVDKTNYIYKIAQEPGYFLLTRPPKFGKTLLQDTLEALFSGDRELFKGLKIDYSDYDFEKYPVVRLNIPAKILSWGALEKSIRKQLKASAEKNGLSLKINAIDEGFTQLVTDLAAKTGRRIVVLIDDYDMPLLSDFDEPDITEKNMEIANNLYLTLLRAIKRDFIRTLFITGQITPTAECGSSFSNHLRNLTLDIAYHGICGFTPTEFTNYFSLYLPGMLEYQKTMGLVKADTTVSGLKKMIFDFYDGYSWDGKHRILNPYSIVQCLAKKKIKPYWYKKFTPNFLMARFLYDPMEFFDVEAIKIARDVILWQDSFRERDISTVLFQTGHLTFDRLCSSPNGKIEFETRFPNREIIERLNIDYLRMLLILEAPNIRSAAKMLEESLLKFNGALLAKNISGILSFLDAREYHEYKKICSFVFSILFRSMNYRVLNGALISESPREMVIYSANGPVFIVEFAVQATNSKKENLTNTEIKTVLDETLQQAKINLSRSSIRELIPENTYKVFEVAVAIVNDTYVKADIY
ncbi:MAG: AAA family ATPase [Deltaproteobacteria bacterium]|jgi:hypothetical protein|nr:AAA family ATPase [Deltaproteobacteria bacterium]